jgi:hypothetical protein
MTELTTADALVVALVLIEAFTSLPDEMPPHVHTGTVLLADNIIRRIEPFLPNASARDAVVLEQLGTVKSLAADMRRLINAPPVV